MILTLFVNGCEGHFVPSPSRTPIVTDEVTARVVGLDPKPQEMRGQGHSRVMVAIDQAADGARILAGSLARPGEPPCEMGSLASSIATDDDLPGNAIHAGSRATFWFMGQFRAFTDSPSRLDFVVSSGGREKCLTLDLTSEKPDEAWTYERPLRIGLSTTMYAFTSQVLGARGSVQSLLTLSIWRGPVRLMAASGMTADICAADGCERDAVGFPLELGAETFPLEAKYVALGIGARYSFVAMGSRLDEGATVSAYHGVSLVPLIALTFPKSLGMGIVGGAKQGSFALEIPIGVVSAVTDYRRPALSLGAGLSLSL